MTQASPSVVAGSKSNEVGVSPDSIVAQASQLKPFYGVRYAELTCSIFSLSGASGMLGGWSFGSILCSQDKDKTQELNCWERCVAVPLSNGSCRS